jgi:hypothetical protein
MPAGPFTLRLMMRYVSIRQTRQQAERFQEASKTGSFAKMPAPIRRRFKGERWQLFGDVISGELSN